MKKILMLLIMLVSMLSACQKVVVATDDIGDEPNADRVKVQFCITQIDQIPFTNPNTRATAISTLCEKISLAIYDGNTKVQQVNQEAADANFGTLSLSLAPASYKVVIVAHNGVKAPTMTTIDKITFDSNKITDTFHYYANFSIDSQATYQVTLNRVVAMFRLITTDPIPANVNTMRFYYTGGSSTLDGVTGLGSVNSRQTEKRTVNEDMYQQGGTFEVYTFPKDTTTPLNMTVTALDAATNSVMERQFENIDIKRNVISQYKGPFFTAQQDPSVPSTPNSQFFTLLTNDVWSVIETNIK